MAAKKNILDEIIESKPLMYVGGGLLAYYLIVKPILVSVGVMKSAEEKYNDTASINADAWNINYWQQSLEPVFPGTPPDVDKMVYDLGHWSGLFHDDYAKVLTVIKQMKTQRQVSFLAYRFQQKNNADLYTYFKTGGGSGVYPFKWWDGLSTAQLTELNTYVNSLPAE